MRKDPPLLAEYDHIIQDQLNSGIIKEVKPSLENSKTTKAHYLSHHAVVREDALTTKVRVVMDGSAKVNAEAPSLNECLYTGPSLTPNILNILLRFRWFEVPIISDIEKAFHMIRVDERDRDSLRFLWIDDINSTDPRLVFLRFCRVVFGLNCSPFLLGGTLRHHITNCKFHDPKFAKELLESIYVDDLINGRENQQTTLKVYELSKACLEKGGFNLRKWRTSDPELQSLIDEIEAKQQTPKAETKFESDETSYAKTVVGGTKNLEPSEQKVLGLKWNYESDEHLLTFDKLIKLSKTMTPTKRNLLKLSASLFDPLGIVSPISVRMKILLQETCKLHLEWNTPLPETLVKVWCEILNDFEQILCISILRCYFGEINEEIEQYSLHAFGDASKKVFCSVIYLVM